MRLRSRRAGVALFLSIVFVIFFVIALFLYFALFNPNYRGFGGEGSLVTKVNPASGLTTEKATAGFNESYISYLLYSFGVQNLHNPPLSGDKPKIKIYV